MIHELKIQEEYANAIGRGDKTFEVRSEQDRCFKANDRILFRVIDCEGNLAPSHSLNKVMHRITYVLRGHGIEDGYAVLAIKPVRGSLSFAANDATAYANAPVLKQGA